MREAAGAIIPDQRSVLSAAVAGLVAGLVGSFVMECVQAALPAPDTGDAKPATVMAADRANRAVTGRPVSKAHRGVAGALAHYALGGTLGAAYGVAAERWPALARGGGIPFGLATAFLLDEALVPATGLSRPPWRSPAGAHVYGLVSHAVFGASVEAARRMQRGRPENTFVFGKPTTSRSVAGYLTSTSPKENEACVIP